MNVMVNQLEAERFKTLNANGHLIHYDEFGAGEWFPKLRAGGIVAGDDYHADWPLVIAAVDRFVADNRLELHVIQCSEDSWNSKYPTWFAMKP